MKNKEHYVKVGFIAVVIGLLLYAAFFAYSQWKAQQAANATANNTDASMDASTAPANIMLGQLPSDMISTGNSEQDASLNTYASYTPQNVQDWVAFNAGASMVPASSWEYDPNYHLPYDVPTLPTGFQAPTVGNGSGTYVYGGNYNVGKTLQLEGM
jgi:hypothetical protein